MIKMKSNFLILLILISTIQTSISGENLYCDTDPNTVDSEVFSFDCSNRHLTWQNLAKLNHHVRGSSTLNLAFNNFNQDSADSAIKNLSFNSFKQLKYKFNLSSNSFKRIDSRAFYFTISITDDVPPDSQLNPLRFTELDLSNNSFEVMPWDSIKNLPNLSILILNKNPLKRLDFGDLTLDKNPSYFKSLTHVYINSSEIEYVDPAMINLLENLKLIDLSWNRIRNIENIFQISRSLTPKLYIDNNPLVCDCNLIWLKTYLHKFSDKTRKNTCFINTRSINENLIVDSQSIYLNKTHSTQDRNDLKHEKNFKNSINLKQENVENIHEDQFYCDLELIGEIEDLSLHGVEKQTVKLDCVVTGYPEPKVKWLLGQKDLYKVFNYENKEFNMQDSVTLNKKFYLYTLKSSLSISFIGELGRENFSCQTFYSNDHFVNKNPNFVKPEPLYLQKSITFSVNSLSYINLHNGQINNNSLYKYMNSTHLMVRVPIQSQSRSDRPFVYWIIIAICVLFSFFFVLFVSYCMIQHKRRAKKEDPIYAYASSNYSTINKRSVAYAGANSIRGDTSTLQPLKPDVIREHQDYTSLYGNFLEHRQNNQGI